MREKLKEHLSRRTVVRAGGHLGVAGTLALLMSPAWSGSRTHAAATAALLPHHSEDVIWKQVSEIFGGTGVIVLGNVLMIKIPRSDLHGTLFGTPIRSALALFALFHFQHVGTQAIVKYEFTLLEHEVSVFLDTLFAQNLQPATSVLGAQHNHFLGLDPRVIHTHGTSVGDPVQIALALRRVLARTGSPLEEVVRSSAVCISVHWQWTGRRSDRFRRDSTGGRYSRAHPPFLRPHEHRFAQSRVVLASNALLCPLLRHRFASGVSSRDSPCSEPNQESSCFTRMSKKKPHPPQLRFFHAVTRGQDVPVIWFSHVKTHA